MAIRQLFKIVTIFTFALTLAGGAAAQSENVNLIANVDSYPGYSDIWGYTAPDGTELAILGASNGTSFVDVTNPAAPNEVLYIPGDFSIWRDFKTYDTYAYIVDDQAGEGLIVVDLSVPTAPTVVRSRFNEFSTAHNIWIDQDEGLAFCCGGSGGSPYTWVYDLTADPSDPLPIFNFDTFYVHDLYTRDGIAYLAAVFNGFLATADISNLPVDMPVLDAIVTDDAFTHNVWTSEDGNYAFTTDERSGGHLTIIDVSNPADMFKVGEYNHPTDQDAIVHNVFIEGDLAHVAWYRNGYEVVDISVPESPERVGFYDTFPGGGDGFDGAWGAYPYADNGYIYVSDMQTGLYVFEFVPNYGTVEGTVTDNVSSNPIEGATVTIGSETRTTNAAGFYKANLDPGSYTIEVSAFGYVTDTFNTTIVQGQTNPGDFGLDRVPSAPLNGNVLTADLLVPIPGATVTVEGTPYSTVSDGSGQYSFDFVPVGTYNVTAQSFGFGMKTESVTLVADVPASRDFLLTPSAVVESFEANSGWTTGGTGSTGEWTRDDPNGTGGGSIQPEDDHTTAPGTDCFFTGQAPPGSSIGENDIDDGTQILTSPVFDLSGLDDPTISYHRWYVNDGNGAVDDVLITEISNDGGDTWTIVENLNSSRAFWENVSFQVEDFVPATNEVQLRVTAADNGFGSIVEAAIDDLEIYGLNETTSTPTPVAMTTQLLGAAPNPFSATLGGEIRFQLAATQDVELEIIDVQGRRVASLVNGTMAAGSHAIEWDGTDSRGKTVPVGVYFQTLTGEDLSQTQKFVVLK